MQAVAGPVAYLSCTDCKSQFSSASSLLKHFAEHILSSSGDGSFESSGDSEDTRSEINGAASAASAGRRSPALEERRPRPRLPELLKINRKRNSTEQQVQPSKEKEDDTGSKDEFNPLTFCVVTMEEGTEEVQQQQQQQQQKAAALAKQQQAVAAAALDPEGALQAYKKYVCTYCNKRFGWSTDLKRHILTHTGERPFQCQLCGATFTRNFLLQKHVLKLHSNNQCVVPVAAPSEPKKPPTSPGALAVSPEPPLGAATEVRRDLKPTLKTPTPSAAKRQCLEPLATVVDN